MAYYTVAHLL
jgi:leucyl-tRNA synthetase